MKDNERVPTTILCNKALKESALKSGIVLSTTLEEGLRMKLAFPENAKQDITKLIKEYEAKINYLKSEEFEAEKKQIEIAEERKANEKRKDTKLIHDLYIKRLNGQTTDETYNKIVRNFVTKWGMDFASAIALSQAKQKEGVC